MGAARQSGIAMSLLILRCLAPRGLEGSKYSLPRVFAEALADILGAEDVAGGIGGDAFAARFVGVGVGARDEVFDRAVLGAADADAAATAGVGGAAGILGLRVGDVDHIVLVDERRARPAELLPFGEELAVRVEDLDAGVDPIGDKDPALGVERDAVRLVELTRAGALAAPDLEDRAVGRELDDPRVAVAAM